MSVCPSRRLAWTFAGALAAACTTAEVTPGAVQRLYVFDVGECHTTDLSRWSPGVNVGRPWVFSDHCYLIVHARGLFLWDSGFADAIAAMPDGLVAAGGAARVHVTKTLASQLA